MVGVRSPSISGARIAAGGKAPDRPSTAFLKHVLIRAMSARPTPRRRLSPGEKRAASPAGCPTPAPVAGLAVSQLRRLRRIVDAAVSLAERGGFDGVRLRDVAEASDVALGTLYKYFRSKEDILLFALAERVGLMETALASAPAEGASPLARCEQLFRRTTLGLTAQPQLARAVLRSLASGDPSIALQIAAFRLRMTRLIVASLRGEPLDPSVPLEAEIEIGTERERQVAFVLMNVWYSSLAGWAGGLHAPEVVVAHVRMSAELMSVASTPSPGLRSAESSPKEERPMESRT